MHPTRGQMGNFHESPGEMTGVKTPAAYRGGARLPGLGCRDTHHASLQSVLASETQPFALRVAVVAGHSLRIAQHALKDVAGSI